MSSVTSDIMLSSADTHVNVVFQDTDLAHKIVNNDFLLKYIPGLVVSTKHSVVPDAMVEFVRGDARFHFDTYPRIKIGVGDLTEKDVISLVELVFERARQEKGIFCIHSSCAVYEGKAVIFWGGASGMGKTRLAKLLAKYGTFYSDEKTLVDAKAMEVCGGIPYLYLEKDYWKKSDSQKTSDSYYGIKSDFSKTIPIGLMVYAFGVDGAELSANLWNKEKFEWHLYEEVGRKIRAISRRVSDGKISVPSIDSQVNGDRRIGYVKHITGKIPCYSIQGSPDSVVDYIKNIDIWR